MKLFTLLALLVAPFQSVHALNPCETTFDKDAAVISKVLKSKADPLRWKKYEKFLGTYQSCLDGGYAELVQSLSEDALANDWDQFTAYVNKQKPNLKVLRSEIETGFSTETGLPENLRKIKSNAKRNCPSTLASFCKKIRNAKIE